VICLINVLLEGQVLLKVEGKLTVWDAKLRMTVPMLSVSCR
jgi:hypothetical protein